MNLDDRRYLTHEQRAQDDPRYRPGGVFGIKLPKKNRSINCSCGKTNFVDANGTANSSKCPQCNDTFRPV